MNWDDTIIRSAAGEQEQSRLRVWLVALMTGIANYWYNKLERAEMDLVQAVREIAPMEWYWLAFLFLVAVLGWYCMAMSAGTELRMW